MGSGPKAGRRDPSDRDRKSDVVQAGLFLLGDAKMIGMSRESGVLARRP